MFAVTMMNSTLVIPENRMKLKSYITYHNLYSIGRHSYLLNIKPVLSLDTVSHGHKIGKWSVNKTMDVSLTKINNMYQQE